VSYGTFNSATFYSSVVAGQQGMAASLEKAEKADPQFKDKAREAILAHLKAVGQASGEELVCVAKAHGATPANGDRAFGGVFRALSSQKLIRCIRSDLPRSRGHGTSGGKLWGLYE
jgi:hypothetical protein